MSNQGNLSSLYRLRLYQLNRLREDYKNRLIDEGHFVSGLSYLGYSSGSIRLELADNRPVSEA